MKCKIIKPHLQAKFIVETNVALNPQIMDRFLAVDTFEIHLN